MVFYGYLKEVLVRFKYLLGGGSLFVIVVGIIEHFKSNSVTWAFYLWIVAACFVVALFVEGASQFKRLQPRMVIIGPHRQEWDASSDIGYSCTAGCGYYFDIVNLSETESLENVLAECVGMEPHDMSVTRVQMKVKNDDYKTREFSINANSVRQIDFVTGPSGVPGCQNLMILAHTVPQGMVLSSSPCLKPLPPRNVSA